MGAQSISNRSADHPLNFTAAVLSPREVSDGHHVVDSGARLALVKALALLDPRNAGFSLDERSVERRPGFYVMADEESVYQQLCDAKRTTSPGGRLMDLRTAAAYLGCSYWTLRDLVLNGHIPAVRIRALARGTAV